MKDFDYESVGAGYYDAIFAARRGVRKFWHQYKFEMIRGRMSDVPGLKVLDVGCAAGSFLGLFCPKGVSGLGVDLSKAQVDYANRKYGSGSIRFEAGDVRRLDLEPASFDCIVMSEVIEHIEYAEALDVLKSLRRLLRPGGKLFVTTPNYRSLWPAIELCVNKMSPISYEHQHINKLHRKSAEELLRRAGFEVLGTTSFFIAAPFLAFISQRLSHTLCRLESFFLSRLGSIILLEATVL